MNAAVFPENTAFIFCFSAWRAHGPGKEAPHARRPAYDNVSLLHRGRKIPSPGTSSTSSTAQRRQIRRTR
jgi:hypothetical protein